MMTKKHSHLNYQEGDNRMLARIERFPAFSPLVGEMFTLSEGLDSLFAGADQSPAGGNSAFAPPLDVAESNEQLVVVAELPGVKKEDVKISVDKGILTLSGERKKESSSPETRSLLRENRQGKFSRAVRLPYEVNTAGVSAELSEGILKIVLPKAEAAKAHQISVR
jgi:HSP20 family protein